MSFPALLWKADERKSMKSYISCVFFPISCVFPRARYSKLFFAHFKLSLGSYISESNAPTIDSKSIFSWMVQIVIAVETHFESGSAQQQSFYKMGNDGFLNKISFNCQCVKTDNYVVKIQFTFCGQTQETVCLEHPNPFALFVASLWTLESSPLILKKVKQIWSLSHPHAVKKEGGAEVWYRSGIHM